MGHPRVSLAGPGPDGHGKSRRVPQKTEIALGVTAYPSPTYAQENSRAGRGGGIGKGTPEEPYHVDYSGHLVDDGLGREVQHTEKTCRKA